RHREPYPGRDPHPRALPQGRYAAVHAGQGRAAHGGTRALAGSSCGVRPPGRSRRGPRRLAGPQGWERSMSKNQGEGAKPRMKRKEYEKELRKLQTELCRLQEWVVQAGVRATVVFEGRDAAGKGGTIKAITERVSPRVFRVVALPAPSDREKTQ